eukprot:5975846-Karenia_brevis.AAC.1
MTSSCTATARQYGNPSTMFDLQDRNVIFVAHLGIKNYAVGVGCALEKMSASLRALANKLPDHMFL